LWLAISERGISEPVFVKAGLAVTAKVYIEKCLPVLKNFIQKYHSNDKIIFWPDLAAAHYAKVTLTAFGTLNIQYVPKQENHPNVPQLRPIETLKNLCQIIGLFCINLN